MEFSPEYWPKRRIGDLQRRKLVAILKKRLSRYPSSPGLTLDEIESAVDIGKKQIKRHLAKLIGEGKIYRRGDRYFYREREKSVS